MQNNLEHHLENISFKDVFEEVRADIEQSLLETNAVIEHDFQVSHLLYTQSGLRSIFSNLLSNAVKYRSEKRPLKIYIRTFRQGEYDVLTVCDNGLLMRPSLRSFLRCFSGSIPMWEELG